MQIDWTQVLVAFWTYLPATVAAIGVVVNIVLTFLTKRELTKNTQITRQTPVLLAQVMANGVGDMIADKAAERVIKVVVPEVAKLEVAKLVPEVAKLTLKQCQAMSPGCPLRGNS
jgi:peroxiredoxin family protein